MLEFLGPDGDGDIDPHEAEVVRAVNDRPTEELGVEYVDASELALSTPPRSRCTTSSPTRTSLPRSTC